MGHTWDDHMCYNGRDGPSKYNKWTNEDINIVLAKYSFGGSKGGVTACEVKYILGLSEVRREGEDTTTLESGHVFYYRQGDSPSHGGVGFLVNKVLIDNVVEISSVSSRVAYLIIRLTKRYSLKVVQVYAPTSSHSDTEVEIMYDDIYKALNHTTKAHFSVIMGDFNAKVGTQSGPEFVLGQHGYGSRNHRGQMLVNFLEMNSLFLMNSFFKKRPHRKWTWKSPDNITKNEIDFIITDKRYIFRDVSVISRFNTGSDHRLVRSTLNIDYKLERIRLMKSSLRHEALTKKLKTSFRCLKSHTFLSTRRK
ncbi:jg26126 [Pararge aegeria aegeria]|uniref:Jg26126 protein n=1 Tax=Pararge aegeria aegeria TaxID=348720 RepID=A0A8S4S028_9NEOP|nr:jg26126 [Pararge aegeria aegeria]